MAITGSIDKMDVHHLIKIAEINLTLLPPQPSRKRHTSWHVLHLQEHLRGHLQLVVPVQPAPHWQVSETKWQQTQVIAASSYYTPSYIPSTHWFLSETGRYSPYLVIPSRVSNLTKITLRISFQETKTFKIFLQANVLSYKVISPRGNRST